MITITEAIVRFKEYGIVTDPLTIERWIRQRKIAVVRSGDGGRDRHISEEALASLLSERLRQENTRLVQENCRLAQEQTLLIQQLHRLRQEAIELAKKLNSEDLPF